MQPSAKKSNHRRSFGSFEGLEGRIAAASLAASWASASAEPPTFHSQTIRGSAPSEGNNTQIIAVLIGL